MTIVGVAMRHVRGRLLPSALTVMAVALGVGLIIGSVLLTRGIRDGLTEGATGYALVVGAKGSPTQLVMSALFRTDLPTPNIPSTQLEHVRADPRVALAVPVALGDAFQGYRYVATTTAYFTPQAGGRSPHTLHRGRLFQDDGVDRPGHEAVLGAEVARRTGLRLGDRFYEGEEMAAHPLTVVGILRPTVRADDRAIFLSLPTYWAMNELARSMPVKPITAVLVRAHRLSDVPALHRELNLARETQAALPSVVLLGIFNLVGLVEDLLSIVLALVALVVMLYVFVSMYGAALERRRGIATMRALGARRVTILGIVLLEGGVVSLVGGLVGIVIGHGIAFLGAQILSARGGLVSDPFALSAVQPLALAGVVVLGTLGSLLPAIVAYRTEVADNLAPMS